MRGGGKRNCQILIIIFYRMEFFLSLLIKLFRLTQSLLSRALFYLEILKTYFSGNECAKLKDCVLLYELRKNQPPASDRYIEYPWMLENIPIKQGRLLDVGSTVCDKLYETLPKEIEINCLNVNEKKCKHSEIKFFKCDIRKTDFQDNYFDCITCISTIEHVGVAGRYNSDDDPEGDIKSMEEIKRILKPKGILLITVPYGIKDMLPINKLYNKGRLEKLFNGFDIENIKFRKFSERWGVWLKVAEEKAATTDMLKDRWYALCLIKAKKI